MSRIITLTNKFCRTTFEMEKLKTADDLNNILKYVTADVKPIHWKLLFIQMYTVNSFDKDAVFKLNAYSKAELMKELGVKKNYTLAEVYEIIEYMSDIKFKFDFGDEGDHKFYMLTQLRQDSKKDGIIKLQLNEGFSDYMIIGDVRKCEVKDSEDNEDGIDGFTQFDYDELMSLNNTYAIRLFLYLYTLKKHPSTSLSIENLYKLLNVDKNYTQRDLVSHVIKKACSDISKNTKLKVTPKSVIAKGSKKTTSVNFLLEIVEDKAKSIKDKKVHFQTLVVSIAKKYNIQKTSKDLGVELKQKVIQIQKLFKEHKNVDIASDEILTCVGYCGGDMDLMVNLLYKAVEDKKIVSRVGWVKSQAKKEGVKPLKMYK